MNRTMSSNTFASLVLCLFLLSACRSLASPTATPPAVSTPLHLPGARALTALPSPAPTAAPPVGLPPPRTSTPTATASPSPTLTPTASLSPTPTPTASRSPTPTVAALTIAERDLGAPGVGDAYSPADLAVDAQRSLAYVYCLRGPNQRPVLAVVDIARERVTRLWPLAPLTGQGGGQLLLAPDGAAIFVVDREAQVLVSLNPLTGKLGHRLDHVRTAALSADGAALVTADAQSLAAYSSQALAGADNPTPLWRQNLAQVDDLALNGDRILVWRRGAAAPLQVRAAADGRLLAEAALPDAYPSGLAALPDGGWAVRANGSVAQVQRFSADLQQVITTTVPSGSGLFFDAPRNRLLLGGYRYDAPSAASSQPVIQALDASNLVVQTEQGWPNQEPPEIFARLNSSRLLALARAGASHLDILDPGTLSVPARLILGVRLLDMALDEGSATLFVADDQDRIHLVNLATGRVRAVWRGRAPIALDRVNHRLYVNRPATLALLLDKTDPPFSSTLAAQIVALDANSGALLATFAQTGVPAPDPARDRVYIAQNGITIYTRAGTRVDALKATFPTPHGFSPNPAAYGVLVNPVSGYVLALMNNGVPGSNNSSYVQLFAPGSQRPISVPGHFSFITDIAFAANGDAYLSYSMAKNQEAIQWLSPNGQERGRLSGLTGRLALDDKGQTLWASVGASLAAVQTSPFTLQGFKQGPAQVEQLIFDAGRRQLYARFVDSPRVAVLPVAGLAPQTIRPQALAGWPAAGLSAQDLALDPTGRWFYVNAGSTVFRTSDGRRWERIDFGQSASFGYLAVAALGALFHASVSGADGGVGVYRSRDAGATWELLAAGLSDLRGAQPVAARSADEAYFVSRTSGLYAWQPASQRWQQILASENDYSALGALTLAPDGALFLLNYDRMRRSGDHGATWSEVKMPMVGGVLLGFAANYTTTQTVFGLFGSEPPRLFRATDGGRSWAAIGASLALPAFVYNVKLLSAPQVLYLYHSDVQGKSELFRSLDNGDTWQAATAAAVQGTTQAALAPDGRLWFSRQDGLRALAPGDAGWRALP
jgi:photosystem II stability/assembly factor-like uncharacterized protein